MGKNDCFLTAVGRLQFKNDRDINDTFPNKCESLALHTFWGKYQKKTEIAVVYFPNNNFNLDVFYKGLRLYEGLEKKNDGQFLKFKRIIVVLKNGNMMQIK
jgi:hypothetical protein